MLWCKQHHSFIYPKRNGVSNIILSFIHHQSPEHHGVFPNVPDEHWILCHISLLRTECSLWHSPSRHCLNWGISVLVWTFNFPLYSQQCQLPVPECSLGQSPSRHCVNLGISVLVWTFNVLLFSQQCQLAVLQCLLNMGKRSLTII